LRFFYAPAEAALHFFAGRCGILHFFTARLLVLGYTFSVFEKRAA
jgi:hypothetical protein